MLLQGSCHCGAVRYRVRSSQPVPYQRCYCSICRKTQGGGGYTINIAADAGSLEVEGQDAITVYNAHIGDRISTGERSFCSKCGSALWLFSPEWPELLHPFASSVDTELPIPPEHTHLMLGSKASWVEVQDGPEDKWFDEYPEESIADWHKRTGMTTK